MRLRSAVVVLLFVLSAVPAFAYRTAAWIPPWDSACASACLDFADRIHVLPRSTHAGLSTSADSVYMEVRGVTLPSGIGRLGLPVKVYRNWPRGHNEPYVPDQPYSGDINDTAALETWITAMMNAPARP